MIVTLKSYLAELEEEELAKPLEKRRAVPTLTELAEAAGVHKGTLSRIANNQVRSLTFDVGEAIIGELRRRKFNTEVGDIVRYREPKQEKASTM